MNLINAANMAAGNQFQDANPGVGQQATSLNAEWCNGLQNEVVGVIEAGGLTPTAGVYNQLLHAVVNIVYPVGAYYFTEDDSHPPGTLFSWQTWTEVTGVVLVGRDTAQTEFATTGLTGGEKTHTLTVDELASHSHTTSQAGTTATTGDQYTTTGGTSGTDSIFIGPPSPPDTGDTGGGEAHNNLQPYRVVRMWRRSA